MLKDIFFPIAETQGDENALVAAIALAETMGAHLALLQGVHFPLPPPGAWGTVPDTIFLQTYREIRQAGVGKTEALRARLQKEAISWEVHMTENYSAYEADTAAAQARFCDLSVMPTCAEDSPDWSRVHTLFNSLLLSSGRPVLTIPEGASLDLLPRHAVVCWEPSRTAARALHDALPLLRLVDTVDILHIEEKIGHHTDGDLPGYSAALHLQRHGIEARAVGHTRLPSASTSTMLLSHAHQTGAQLIVAGGYGHSRVREWVLGGTTRTLLAKSPVPVLFSH